MTTFWLGKSSTVMLPGVTTMSPESPRTPLPERITEIPVAIDCGSTFDPGLNLIVICWGAWSTIAPSVRKAPELG